MKRFNALSLTILLAAAVCLAAGAAWAAEVSQGKCIQFDESKHLITLEEYDTQFNDEHPFGKSTGLQLVFNVTDAKIGAKPEPGNILRLAWVAQKDQKVALKVMNITKTNLMKK